MIERTEQTSSQTVVLYDAPAGEDGSGFSASVEAPSGVVSLNYRSVEGSWQMQVPLSKLDALGKLVAALIADPALECEPSPAPPVEPDPEPEPAPDPSA
jgi:hypothetical protein